MNLFKKIWTKNFLKAQESIDKFSEDIGGLKGEFSWIKYRNGIQEETFKSHNEITSLSKSTVIRLLAQGTSSWTGAITPAQYRISKMRFGNAPPTSHTTNNSLNYYSLDEVVYRDNSTNTPGVSPAGGRYTIESGNTVAPGAINSNSKSDVTKDFEVSSFGNGWIAGGNITIGITPSNLTSNTTTYTSADFNQTRPPSHTSLVVQLLNSSNAVLSTMTFGSIYSRDADGNSPSINQQVEYVSNTAANHKLYYVFPTGTQTTGYWAIEFRLGSGNISAITKVRVKFKIGQFNIINSIVPKTGYNLGSGNANERFPLSSGIDYYSTVTPVYNNSEGASFIDDFSATFSITMAQNEGNGISGLPVYYTEAFLFNERDDLFSIVRYSPRAFEKTSSLSYLISWTIKAIV